MHSALPIFIMKPYRRRTAARSMMGRAVDHRARTMTRALTKAGVVMR